jgi:hypothetical protein
MKFSRKKFIKKKFIKKYNSNLGNILSDYFYNKYANNKIINISISDNNVKDLYNAIVMNDKYINYTSNYNFAYGDKDKYDSNKWHSLGREGFMNFWKEIRPIVKNVYDVTAPDIYKNVKYPVIHFRCSDSPFNRHNDYHIPKLSTIKWISTILKQRNINKVIFLSCSGHRTIHECDKPNKIICNKLSYFYMDLFEDYGIKCIPHCGPIIDDFFMMIYSPLLISLNSSSFSFIAGISKHPNDYISCDMGTEKRGIYYKDKKVDWLMDKNTPILNKNVVNYYDLDEIVNKILY